MTALAIFSRKYYEHLAPLFIKLHPSQTTQCKTELPFQHLRPAWKRPAWKLAFMVPATNNRPKQQSAQSNSCKSGCFLSASVFSSKRHRLSPSDKLVALTELRSPDLSLGDLPFIDGHTTSFCQQGFEPPPCNHTKDQIFVHVRKVFQPKKSKNAGSSDLQPNCQPLSASWNARALT